MWGESVKSLLSMVRTKVKNQEEAISAYNFKIWDEIPKETTKELKVVVV